MTNEGADPDKPDPRKVVGLGAEPDASEVLARLRSKDARCARLYADYMLKAPARYGATPVVARAMADVGLLALQRLESAGPAEAITFLERETGALDAAVDGEDEESEAVEPLARSREAIERNGADAGERPASRWPSMLAALARGNVRSAWQDLSARERRAIMVAGSLMVGIVMGATLGVRWGRERGSERILGTLAGTLAQQTSVNVVMDDQPRTFPIRKQLSAGLFELEGLELRYVLEVRDEHGWPTGVRYICEWRDQSSGERKSIPIEGSVVVADFALQCRNAIRPFTSSEGTLPAPPK